MRSRIALITMVGLLGAVGIAAAGPGPKPTPRTPDSDVHITMVAGKGRLGVAVLQISADLRAHFGAPADRGVLVDSIRADSVAAKAGLRPGDVIVELDGAPVDSATDMLGAMSDRKKGDTIPIVIFRNGQRSELRATLADDPGPALPQVQRWTPSFDDEDFPMPSFGKRDDLRKRLDDLEKRLQRLEKRT
jgi:C-terminal processing protease CtpA/Prc